MTTGQTDANPQVDVAHVTAFLAEWASAERAEKWDNVGLLLGDSKAGVNALMTCLTLTPDVAQEAVDEGAQLVISHHPILFRPVQKLVADSAEGEMLLALIRAGVAVYSPHTGYDSARDGINAQLSRLLGLENVRPLRPLPVEVDEAPEIPGSGRFGNLPAPLTLGDFRSRVKQQLRIEHVQFVGDSHALVEKVAIACGSAAEFLPDAHREGCQVLLTGEARFHACLEARNLAMALLLPGHYATERPAMEYLAELLGQRFPGVRCWASRRERDPVQWD